MFADSNDPKISSLRERIQAHRSGRDGAFSIAECDKAVFEELKAVVVDSKVPAKELASMLGLDLNHVYAIRSMIKIAAAKRRPPRKKKLVKFKQIVVREPPRPSPDSTIRFVMGGSEISVEVDDAEIAVRLMQLITKAVS